MSEDTSSKEIQPPKRIWELLEKYLALSERYDQRWIEIHSQAQEQITRYFQEQSAQKDYQIPDTSAFLEYLDEFVDNLLIYYAYYRSVRRSMATLFASIGITDHRMFAEMVRVASDPRIKINIRNLDVQGVGWFLKQFQDEYEVVVRNKDKLAKYLPKLEFATKQTYSEAMQRFLDVLQYATSQQANELQKAGYNGVSKAIAEENLSQKVNLVVEAIEYFVSDAQKHPTFILTESVGYFGAAELEEFDSKITTFKKVHELFKEHVSLSTRTQWIYERQHTTLFTSIFEGSHLELVELRDKIRAGESVHKLESHIRDCQGMLLGVSQAYSLYLEFSAYSQQMLTLVDAYRQIGEFLQSELLHILYTLELQKNNLYLEVRDDFRQTMDKFQQTLIKVCSLDSSGTP